jgi:hypothetical protein
MSGDVERIEMDWPVVVHGRCITLNANRCMVFSNFLLLRIPVMICYYLDADDHDSLAKTHARLDKFIGENREVRIRC